MHPRYRGSVRLRPHRLCTLLVFLGGLAAAPAAADTSVRARGTLALVPEPGQGFNLYVERRDLDVDYVDASPGDRLEVGRIGIGWYESPVHGVRLGLTGGRQKLQQSDRSATAGRELTGYFAGLNAASGWSIGEHLLVEIRGSLEYSEVEDGGMPRVDLDWWSASLRPAVGVQLGDAVTLRAGTRAFWLEGDERVSGANASTTEFREAEVGGAFAGLDLHTGREGRVGLRVDAGPVRAVRVVFERRY